MAFFLLWRYGKVLDMHPKGREYKTLCESFFFNNTKDSETRGKRWNQSSQCWLKETRIVIGDEWCKPCNILSYSHNLIPFIHTVHIPIWYVQLPFKLSLPGNFIHTQPPKPKNQHGLGRAIMNKQSKDARQHKGSDLVSGNYLGCKKNMRWNEIIPFNKSMLQI